MAEGGHNTETDTTEQKAMACHEENEDVAMQRLLQQMKSERIDELRQIKQGERPVTGTESRNNINSFFAKRIDAHAAAEGKENVPVNVDSVEEHRPDTVVVEIQGLVEQQRVSNTLTTNFRRHLENIIRGSISSVTRNHTQRPSPQSSARPSPQSSARPSPSPQNSERLSPVPQPRNSISNQSPVPAPRLRNTALPQHLTDRSRSNSVASTNSLASTENDVIPSSHTFQPIPNSQPDFPRVERLVPPEYQSGSDRVFTQEEIENLHRENIVQEISELVHRQLVTTTLESTFRNVLEISMQDRVGQSGADGERVQEFVRSIHPTQPIQRNDFSNIGIPPVQNDNWDNISITSVSAHAVPYTQTNTYMSREIHGLKAQLQEMKNMMRQSFDLQLDIQRAIRQEVAAALSQVQGGATGISTEVKSKPVSDTHCLICLDNHSDSVLYQCGHMCVCYTCGQNLVSRGSKCPVCRAPIKDIIRAYKSNID